MRVPESVWQAYGKRMAAVWLFVMPVPALASTIACQFSQECLSGETCSDTSFAATLEAQGPQNLTNEAGDIEITAAFGTMTTDAETIAGILSFDKDTAGINLFVSFPASAGHYLTLQPDGAAYYTTHIPEAELAITYTGTCEASE